MVYKFIKLTSASFNTPIYVNADHVSSVHSDFDGSTNNTIVNMSFGAYKFYRVKESVETVVKCLHETLNP